MSLLVLSLIILTYPVQGHFPRLISAIMSVSFVYSLTLNDVCFLSRYIMFSLLLSIFVSGDASLCFARLVSARVFALYVTAGISMSYRRISSSCFHSYTCICPSAWRMLSIRP